MEREKISIIMPIYRVEQYLEKCLDSILSQTYTNLEIILVDDGSKDKSGEICDRYAAQDARIKVIHKENGGVGSARNAGLDAATGDYIAWVDPDDWIDKDMYAYLHQKMKEYNAQISICSYYIEHTNWREEKKWAAELCFSTEEALELLMEDHDMRSYMWCCLFRRELFVGKHFKNIHIYEDMDIMWRLFEQAQKIVCLPKAKYHYLMRDNGAVAKKPSYQAFLYLWNIVHERYDALKEKYPRYKTLMQTQCIVFARDVWCLYNGASEEEKLNTKKQIEQIAAFCNKHYDQVKEYILADKCSKEVDLLLNNTDKKAFQKAEVYSRIKETTSGYRVTGFGGIDSIKIKATYGHNHRLEPSFKMNNVPIVFAANDSFCPYMSVMIQSLIDCSDKQNNYDIIILNRDISLISQKRLLSMVEERDNFSIRFVNTSSMIKNYDFFVGGKEDFTIDTYLRLLIPDVLSETYHKIIYLDGDMITLADVAELMRVDIQGYLLASCRDISGLGAYYDENWADRREYRDHVLQLKNPDDYFIAGILIMNLDEFRANYTSEWLLQFATSRQWIQHDQDVLNIICDGGKAKLIHAKWNVLKMYNTQYIPAPYYQELLESYEDPKIVHFGGDEKPWKRDDAIFLDEFWEIAARSPFYPDIVRRTLNKGANLSADEFNEAMVAHYYAGQAGFKHIPRMLKGWLDFKVKRVMNRHGIRGK